MYNDVGVIHEDVEEPNNVEDDEDEEIEVDNDEEVFWLPISFFMIC